MKDQTHEKTIDGWLAKTGGYAKDMTLRDAMAIAAMQALTHKNYFDVAAKQAYQMANAMLEARNAAQ